MSQLNDTHKLINPDSGTEIKPGATIMDFRIAAHVFRYISRAPGGNSGGKIITDAGFELYPSVFGLKIVPRAADVSRQLFEVTVADEQGVVIDTGWVAMEVPTVPAGASRELPVAGAALFDAVLEYGLAHGIKTTREDAASAT